jgi:hypothetical protein
VEFIDILCLIKELWPFKCFFGCKFDRRYVVFSKKIFVSDSNEIAVSYRIGCVEFRHNESSAHRPHLLVWEPKIAKNLSFFGFL